MDWRPLPYSPVPVRLYVGEVEVARLCARLDGTWYAMLDQHLMHELRTQVDCSSFDSGKAGVEAWARRHADRLQREVAGLWAGNRDRV